MATYRSYRIEGQFIKLSLDFNTETSDVSLSVILGDETTFKLNNKNNFTLDDIDDEAVKDQLESIIECFNREIICFVENIVSTDNYITNDRAWAGEY